jgi:hypothetical protein
MSDEESQHVGSQFCSSKTPARKVMKSPKMSGKPQEKWTAIRWIAREELLLTTTAKAVSEKAGRGASESPRARKILLITMALA